MFCLNAYIKCLNKQWVKIKTYLHKVIIGLYSSSFYSVFVFDFRLTDIFHEKMNLCVRERFILFIFFTGLYL